MPRQVSASALQLAFPASKGIFMRAWGLNCRRQSVPTVPVPPQPARTRMLGFMQMPRQQPKCLERAIPRVVPSTPVPTAPYAVPITMRTAFLYRSVPVVIPRRGIPALPPATMENITPLRPPRIITPPAALIRTRWVRPSHALPTRWMTTVMRQLPVATTLRPRWCSPVRLMGIQLWRLVVKLSIKQPIWHQCPSRIV